MQEERRAFAQTTVVTSFHNSTSAPINCYPAVIMPCSPNNADSHVFRYPHNSLLGLLASQRYQGSCEYDRAASHPPIFPAVHHHRTYLDESSSSESSERSSRVSEILQEALDIVDRSRISMCDRNRRFPRSHSQDVKNDDNGSRLPQ